MSRIKEIWDLAEHHKKIIERKFLPRWRCVLYELESNAVMRVEKSNDSTSILVIVFSSSFLRMIIPHHRHLIESFEEMDYANPRFTDNILSDVLKEILSLGI